MIIVRLNYMKGTLSFFKKNKCPLSYLIVISRFFKSFFYHLGTLC